MKLPRGRMLVNLVALALAGASLAACGTSERLANVGRPPAMTAIQSPTTLPAYQNVSLPMPAPETEERQPNSLWRQGSRAFLKDQRANRVGDILTVVINIDEGAQIDNSTSRSRNASEGAGADALLGLETKLAKVFPTAVDPSNLASASADSSSAGEGKIDRKESIDLRIATLVTQVLPNGNMVIAGRQEVRVNNELRDLQVVGVIRPEDVTSTNTIDYDKIAEARISYGGRGQITDVQQPRYGQQVFDILFPF